MAGLNGEEEKIAGGGREYRKGQLRAIDRQLRG